MPFTLSGTLHLVPGILRLSSCFDFQDLLASIVFLCYALCSNFENCLNVPLKTQLHKIDFSTFDNKVLPFACQKCLIPYPTVVPSPVEGIYFFNYPYSLIFFNFVRGTTMIPIGGLTPIYKNCGESITSSAERL